MATITITPGWAGPASAVGTNPIVVQVAGVGPTGPAGTSGVAPSGTGIVTVTSGTLGTPAALTGDVTTTAGGLATTLATVNSNVGQFTNATIRVNAKGLVTEASSGAAGGITIGDTVTSGTSGRVLYVGAGPVLAQDAGLTYDPATDTLTTGRAVVGAGTPDLYGTINVPLSTNGYLFAGYDAAANNKLFSISNTQVSTATFQVLFGLCNASGYGQLGGPGAGAYLWSFNSAIIIQDYSSYGIKFHQGGTTTLQASTGGNWTFARLVNLGTYTVATLPSASANSGAFAQVTDSNSTTNGGTVAGGGANRVPVFSNGTNWIIK